MKKKGVNNVGAGSITTVFSLSIFLGSMRIKKRQKKKKKKNQTPNQWPLFNSMTRAQINNLLLW